jgi:Ca2+-binding EF-hand superfamily protein
MYGDRGLDHEEGGIDYRTEERQLGSKIDDDVILSKCPDDPGMFTMVDAAVSFKVVSCFLGIVVFQLTCEHILEYCEHAAHGTVYAAVLHKTYRELMLLGFVAFIIFFIVTMDSITDSFIASFEYADFVMFFVGMSFISQSVWSCVANYSVKAFTFKACHMKTQFLVAKHNMSRSLSMIPIFSFNHNAVRMQLFRHIFLSVYDLPDKFSFPHYFGVSLDALTADLVELLPSSYLFLCLLIIFSEYVVRHYPHTYETLRHPSRRESISEESAILLYGLMGFMIFVTDIVILYICNRATAAINKHRFSKQMEEGTGNEESRLNSALRSTTVNGGFRKSRSFAKLMLDVMPFMDDNKNAGVQEIQELNRRRREEVAKQLEKAKQAESQSAPDPEAPGDDTRGSSIGRSLSKMRSSVYGISSRMSRESRGSLDTEDEDSRRGDRSSIRFANDTSQPRSRSASQRRARRSSSAKLARSVSKKIKASSNIAGEMIATTRMSKAEKEMHKTKEKRSRSAMRMAKHASRINSKHHHGGARLFEILSESDVCVNNDTERINEVVREAVPGSSITGIRRFIDALRLISNFYIAIFICTFITGSHIAMNMGPISRAGNLVGLFTVMFANTFLDPLVTFEYTIMRTMGVINPLLVGTTIDHVAELDRLLQLLALKILVNYRNIDPNFDETTYIPTSAHLKEVVTAAFNTWDKKSEGYLTRETFADAMDAAGVVLPEVKIKMLFKRLDSFQLNGQIDLDEFWSALAPVVNRTIDEIQGRVEMSETTNNLIDPITVLDENHKRRKSLEATRRMELEAQEEEEEKEAAPSELEVSHLAIEDLIEKSSRKPLSSRDIARLRGLIADLGGHSTSNTASYKTVSTPRGTQATGHRHVQHTSHLKNLDSGPATLPNGNEPEPSVTINATINEAAANKRLEKLMRKEMAKPAKEKSFSIIETITSAFSRGPLTIAADDSQGSVASPPPHGSSLDAVETELIVTTSHESPRSPPKKKLSGLFKNFGDDSVV